MGKADLVMEKEIALSVVKYEKKDRIAHITLNSPEI